MKVDFTIIVPTYNAAGTVVNTLESIAKQSFASYEVLIVDGGSTDGTYSQIKCFIKKDTRFHWFSEKDKGIYDAMNKGISMAKGEWLYFMGADDTFLSDSTLDSVSNYFRNDLHVLYGNVISTRFGGRYDGEFTALKLLTKNICHQSIFFRRSVFHITGNFNLKYKAHADYDHNLKWFLDKRISKCYIPIDITCYADGGYSSIYGDPVFGSDKEKNFLKYCLKSGFNDQIMRHSLKELKKRIVKKKFLSVYYPLLVFIKQVFYAQGFSNYTKL